jgi:hypothetical protein
MSPNKTTFPPVPIPWDYGDWRDKQATKLLCKCTYQSVVRLPSGVNRLWQFILQIVAYPVNTLGIPPDKIIPANPDVLIGIDGNFHIRVT